MSSPYVFCVSKVITLFAPEERLQCMGRNEHATWRSFWQSLPSSFGVSLPLSRFAAQLSGDRQAIIDFCILIKPNFSDSVRSRVPLVDHRSYKQIGELGASECRLHAPIRSFALRCLQVELSRARPCAALRGFPAHDRQLRPILVYCSNCGHSFLCLIRLFLA